MRYAVLFLLIVLALSVLAMAFILPDNDIEGRPITAAPEAIIVKGTTETDLPTTETTSEISHLEDGSTVKIVGCILLIMITLPVIICIIIFDRRENK